jgi:hypothetical protein
MSEYYDNGTVKAAMVSRECRRKPENTLATTPIASMYRDWFEGVSVAKAYLEKVQALAAKNGMENQRKQ